LFVSRRFNPKYKVQADHQLNLELLANRKLRIQYGADVIAHFSSGGLTSRVTDWGFRDDMPALVRRDYGSFYWLLALARRKLGDLFKGRPKQRKEERTKDR
jgi:hypothetical protein